MSLADDIIKGKYKSGKIDYSSSVADTVFGDGYNAKVQQRNRDEEERLRKLREEEEARKRAEELKKQQEKAQRQQEENSKIEEAKKALEELPKANYGPDTSKSKKNEENLEKITEGIKEKERKDLEKAGPIRSTEGLKENGGLYDIKYLDAELNPDKYFVKPPQAFKDGYQFGDISSTFADTVTDATNSLVKGFVGVAETGAEGVTGVIADVAEGFGNDRWANSIRNEIKKGSGRWISNFIDNTPQVTRNSVLGNKSERVLEGVGQTAGYAGLTAVNPIVGTAGMSLSAAGNQFHEGLNDPEMTMGQVRAKAYGSAVIEPFTEHLFGFFGKTGLDNKAADYLSKKVSSKLGEFLVRRGVTALSEGAEEMISYSLDTALDQAIDDVNKATGGKGKALSHPWKFSEAWDQASDAILSAALTNGGIDINNLSNSYNSNASLTQNINEYARTQNINAEIENLQEEKEDIEKKLGRKLSTKEVNKLFENLQQTEQQIQNKQQKLLPVINEENSYSNRLKQEATEEINNSNAPDSEKQMMLNVLNNMDNVTDADMETIRQTIDEYQNNAVEYNQAEKKNIINEKVNEYVEEIKNNFKSEINLETKELNNGNVNQVDYEKAGQSVLSNKAKSLVDKFKRRVFKNNNENIFVSNADINKSISETLRNPEQRPYIRENLAVFSQIDKIIENGREIGFSAKDNKGRSYKDYKYYVSNAYIDGNPYVVEFDTRIQKGSTGQYERHFRLERVYPLNNNEAVSNVVPKTDNSLLNETASTNSIPSSNEEVNTINNYAQNTENDTLNPSEIANIKKENMSTTPKLETKNYKTGNKQSSFTSNILNDAQFLNEDLRQEMGKDENVRYYSGITNAETLEKAYNSLQEGGEQETRNWYSKDEKNITAEDVAKGWILLKQYQDAGDYQSAVEVAKKMRQMGTSAGQAVQAYNIMARMSPEGMFYYAQSELNEAYSKMVEGKSKQWIEKNQSKFELTPEETQTIIDTMKEVGEMEDGREKTVKLAEIQKLVSDKIPPSAGQSIKAWMRISMLFNPKTQVRNVMGNTVVLPVNATADVFSGAMDKLISKKTGVRTTGVTKEGIKGYAKGFRKGLFESYDDFRKGINTRNVEGNRFEIGEGKSFKDKNIGKALNRVDNILSFSLDAGDRGFYEASFTNSINNQLVLNNTTEVTQEMIDIATQEALQRTWQDDNTYTQIVLNTRRSLNKINVKGYGLGDVLIPFAKTPANLTKAIVDYSPVGLVKTLTLDARKFNNSLNNGQYSAQLQHKFVQNLGKGMAGSLLYVLGYGLAKAGIATGESDDDKDVKNFMKNSLGIGSYSIKIGGKSFSYDWAQPVATPLAIMSNYVKYSKDNPDATAITKAIKASTIGSEQLLEQSFLQSINKIFNGNGSALENLSDALLELPARAIPTFSKQIADMVDGTQRTTFEYDNKLKSAANSVIAKIPFASKTLPASVDTLGHEVKKYGGNNNLWNVMFNPANTNKGQLSKAGEEIYNIYMQTGDTTIFPKTAPYYINSKGEKVNMTAQERNKFQTVTGKYVEDALSSLMKDSDYKKLSNDKKAAIINEIVSDSYSKAKYDILKIDSKEYEKKRNTLKDVKPSSYYNYKFKTEDMKKDNEKINVLVNANYTDKEKTALYENNILSSTDKKYPIIKESGININEYLKYKTQEFVADKEDDGTISGKSISGSKKNKVFDYIESMPITYTQKIMLYGMEYTVSDNDQKLIVNYINSIPGKTNDEKLEMLSQFKGFTIYKNGTFKY